MAHIVAVYLCWLFGGLFGLHHFYLGRDKHAFVWWMSLGGFGIGWFRDLWRVPEYLFEANQDIGFLNEFAARRNRFKTGPPFHLARFAGQIMIGGMLAYLFRLVIPEFVLNETPLKPLFIVLLPWMGSATGAHLVANIGYQKTHMKWCLLGAALGIPWMLQDSQSLSMSPVFASILTSRKAEWVPSKIPPKGACTCMKRFLALTFCGMIYLSLWGSVIYFNVHVTTKDGEQVPMYVAVHNFFQSPAWKEMKKTMGDLYQFCNHNGWGNCYQQLIERLDPTGEMHAYRVLEFEDDSPAPEEIQSRCRKLARKWHPDKFKTEEEKEEAQEKFIEIQKACDILNDLRKKRQERSMKSDTGTRDSTKKPREDL